MSSSNRRRDQSPSRGAVGYKKMYMDRQPVVTRISGSFENKHSSCNVLIQHSIPNLDPSLTIGRRKEIDNVMKKARANTNDYWDKKLLEVEEKDPNRWRHTGYKKMYIEGESSSESDRESFRFNRNRGSRSRSRNRKSPSPPGRKRSPNDVRRRSPLSPAQRGSGRRTPDPKRPPRSPDVRRRPRSPPPEPPRRSPGNQRKHTSPSPTIRKAAAPVTKQRPGILPRSKRPPSPPPKVSLHNLPSSNWSHS